MSTTTNCSMSGQMTIAKDGSTIDPEHSPTMSLTSLLLTDKQKAQQQMLQRRPTTISQRAKSNVETKDAARKGLLNIMLQKFSSTPIQPNHDHDDELLSLKAKYNNIQQQDQYTKYQNQIDLFQYDASLTKSEKEYLYQIIQSGDTNSIQSASVILQNEDVFPIQHQQLMMV